VRVDSRTAFLAAMPGGVIEMANVALRVGADPLPIMVLQTMRVGLTVTVAPFLATVLTEHGGAQEIARAEVMSWLTIAALMGASFLGGLALWLIKLPNCWFLGSIVTIAIMGALGLVQGRVPGRGPGGAPGGIWGSGGARNEDAGLLRAVSRV